MRSIGPFLALALIAGTAAASSGGTADADRDAAARDLACPREQVQVADKAGTVYAQGCDGKAMYERTSSGLALKVLMVPISEPMRQQAAKDLGCKVSEVKGIRIKLGPDADVTARARGCGRIAMYSVKGLNAELMGVVEAKKQGTKENP